MRDSYLARAAIRRAQHNANVVRPQRFGREWRREREGWSGVGEGGESGRETGLGRLDQLPDFDSGHRSSPPPTPERNSLSRHFSHMAIANETNRYDPDGALVAFELDRGEGFDTGLEAMPPDAAPAAAATEV